MNPLHDLDVNWQSRFANVELPPEPPKPPEPPVQGPRAPRVWKCSICDAEYRGYRAPDVEHGWRVTAPHSGDWLCAPCAQRHEQAMWSNIHGLSYQFPCYR
jgi:hypothetical protein